MFKYAIRLFIWMLIVWPVVIRGDEPRELQMARQQYKAEIKPATQRYVKNLELIKRRYEQKNDHVASGAVDLEITTATGYLESQAPVTEKKEEQKDESISGKCLLFHPPDNKWMKVVYFRPDGKILGSNNPNEMGWEQRGYNLLLMDGKGQITGTYKYVKQKDGHLYFEQGSDGNVYVVLEEPRG